MTAARYPGSRWLGNGVSGGSWTGGPYKVVLHTTETEGLPGYNDGWSAPHVTYDPETRIWWQHTEFTHAARALRNEPGGVETNRDSALQVEIICYSAKQYVDAAPLRRQWVADLLPHQLADIRAFLEWAHLEFGVDLMWPGRQALSSSGANTPGFRMTLDDWTNFGGVCGHQHVPENTHWDPGALAWDALFPVPEEDDMPDVELTTALQQAMRDARIRGENGRLIAVDGKLGKNTKHGLKVLAMRATRGNRLATRMWAALKSLFVSKAESL